MNISKAHKELLKKIFGTDNIDKVKERADNGEDIESKLLPYIMGDGTDEEEELADDLITILTEEE